MKKNSLNVLNRSYICFLIVFWVIYTAHGTWSPIYNGYQFFELTGLTTQKFNFQASFWSIVNNPVSVNKTTLCGIYPLLGGVGVLQNGAYFERYYNSLASHNILYYQVRFFIIDNWQATENITLGFDDLRISSEYLAFAKNATSTSLCGSSLYNDLPWFTMVGQVPHTNANIVFRIISNTPISTPDQASFGIRDVSLIFSNQTTPTLKTCYRGFDNFLYGAASSQECKCIRGQYLDSSLTCQNCQSNCLECFGPTIKDCSVCRSGFSFTSLGCIQCDSSCETCSGTNSNECLTCKSGLWFHPSNKTCESFCNYPSQGQEVYDDLKICSFPCPINKYLALNGSCLDSCPLPTIPKASMGGFVCKQACPTNNFFSIWNYTCQATCNPPLVQQNNTLCLYPCQSTEFLAWDSSCMSSCSSPLVPATYNSSKYCEYPCSNLQMLYDNGTCALSCDFPFQPQIRNNRTFCVSMCASNQIAYWNGSCLSECLSPFILGQESQVQVCLSPCSNPSDYYYDKEGTCKSSCILPDISKNIGSLKVCSTQVTLKVQIEQQLTPEEVKEVKSAVQTITTTGKIASAAVTAVSIASSANSNSLSLGSLVKMLYYIRYMKIDYPPKLQLMLESQNSSSISLNFGPELPKDVENMFPRYQLPYQFDKYELHSNFLVNYWEGLGSMFIVIFVILLSSIIEHFTRDHNKYVHSVIKWINSVTRWDFFLLIFCTNYDGLAFFGSLQLRTSDPDSFLSILGSIVCVIMNFIGVFVLVRTLYIINQLRKASHKVDDVANPNHILPSSHVINRYKSCKILFRGFKEKFFLQQAFMFFYLTRIYVFDIIIGYLFEYPLFQSILIIIVNILMLLHLGVLRPFKEISNLIEFIINETILAIVNINVLILAILDSYELEATDTRIITGDIIIKANIAFNILAMVFMGFEVVIGLVKVYRVLKSSKEKSKTALIKKLIMIFLEKDGMEIHGHDENHDSNNTKVFPQQLKNTSPKKTKNLVETNLLRASKDASSLQNLDFESRSASINHTFTPNRLSIRSVFKNSTDSFEPTTPEILSHKSSDLRSKFLVVPQEANSMLYCHDAQSKCETRSFPQVSISNREIDSPSYNQPPFEESPRLFDHLKIDHPKLKRLSVVYRNSLQVKLPNDDPSHREFLRTPSTHRVNRTTPRNSLFYNQSLNGKQEDSPQEKQLNLSAIFKDLRNEK